LEPTGFEKKRKIKEYIVKRLGKKRSNIGKSWRELEIFTKNMRTWNVIVTGLCPMGA
jgi:hypothetical protein